MLDSVSLVPVRDGEGRPRRYLKRLTVRLLSLAWLSFINSSLDQIGPWNPVVFPPVSAFKSIYSLAIARVELQSRLLRVVVMSEGLSISLSIATTCQVTLQPHRSSQLRIGGQLAMRYEPNRDAMDEYRVDKSGHPAPWRR